MSEEAHWRHEVFGLQPTEDETKETGTKETGPDRSSLQPRSKETSVRAVPAGNGTQNENAWGPWATLGWMFFAGLIVTVFQGLILTVYAVFAPGGDHAAVTQVGLAASKNGSLVAILTCLTTFLGVGLLALAAYIRWPGRVGPYLALHPVPWTQGAMWVGAIVLVAAATDMLTVASGRSIVPEFSREIYASARVPLLLWLALVVFAPVTEEIAFRGFMFRGLAASRLGTAGAIILSSLFWAAIHLQYDLFGIFTIFTAGLFLGWARSKTGSTYVPIVMHGAMNIIATAEAALAYTVGRHFPF